MDRAQYDRVRADVELALRELRAVSQWRVRAAVEAIERAELVLMQCAPVSVAEQRHEYDRAAGCWMCRTCDRSTDDCDCVEPSPQGWRYL